MASDYDQAGSSASKGGSFSDDYNSAPSSATGTTGDDPTQTGTPDDQSEMGDAPADLDIPAADVAKMQQIKQSGDMAALGTYVAQFLN